MLAILENRDLQAAVAEARQLYEQALSAQRNTTGAQLPEDATKAQQEVTSSKQALDAAQKVYESRKQLFEQGALARRLVEEATWLMFRLAANTKSRRNICRRWTA